MTLKALRERIRYLRANRRVASLMGAQGRERVLREHTWPQVVFRCVDAYRDA